MCCVLVLRASGFNAKRTSWPARPHRYDLRADIAASADVAAVAVRRLAKAVAELRDSQRQVAMYRPGLPGARAPPPALDGTDLNMHTELNPVATDLLRSVSLKADTLVKFLK